MIATEDRLTDLELTRVRERLNLDFVSNGICRIRGNDAWFFPCVRHPRPASVKDQIAHCHEEILDYAKLYLRAAEKHGERCIETSFMIWFRGACSKNENANTLDPKTSHLDMMNEFPLGFVMSVQLCNTSPMAYLTKEVKDSLVHALWHLSKCLSDTRNGTFVDDPKPTSTPTPSSPEPWGPVRVHEKAPRALKWSGSRQRDVAPRKSSKGDARQPSDEGKAESIAAGKARARALRAAERARVAELVERARIVSLGYEIGQGRNWEQ